MSIEIYGEKEFIASCDKLSAEGNSQLDKTLYTMALDMQSRAVKLINTGSRSGKVYGKRKHVASSDKEPPKTDSGALVESITARKLGQLNYTSGSTKAAPHGYWLEFGTRFMAKRPWLEPSFNATLKAFDRLFK